ncbi:MAG: hypothetical protein LQ350_004643, partial [Teloschistes chrysophthalmus]
MENSNDGFQINVGAGLLLVGATGATGDYVARLIDLPATRSYFNYLSDYFPQCFPNWKTSLRLHFIQSSAQLWRNPWQSPIMSETFWTAMIPKLRLELSSDIYRSSILHTRRSLADGNAGSEEGDQEEELKEAADRLVKGKTTKKEPAVAGCVSKYTDDVEAKSKEFLGECR